MFRRRQTLGGTGPATVTAALFVGSLLLAVYGMI